METSVKNKKSCNSIDLALEQFRKKHLRPSFEEDLYSREFSSYVCKRGKLFKQSLLRDEGSKISFDKDLMDLSITKNSFSQKKNKLVSAFCSSKNLKTDIIDNKISVQNKENQLNNNDTNKKDNNENNQNFLSNPNEPNDKEDNILEIHKTKMNCNECQCIMF